MIDEYVTCAMCGEPDGTVRHDGVSRCRSCDIENLRDAMDCDECGATVHFRKDGVAGEFARALFGDGKHKPGCSLDVANEPAAQETTDHG